ncbi:MAG: ComF family protein [Woeseiaceae bacterium]
MRRLPKATAAARVLFRALRQLDDAIMPMRCAFCGTRTGDHQKRICCGCLSDLPWIENACAQCARPLEVALPAGVHCASCQAHPPPFTATVAPVRYEFPVDAGLKALKFSRRLHYAAAFASLLTSCTYRLPEAPDALLPVPLHWRRQVFRGFNQARELSRPVARFTGLPIIDIARRRRATSYQSGLSAPERRRNLHDVFAVPSTAHYCHVIIVDDVVTTGETTRQLAKALIDSGIKQVSVLAVARAVRLR